MKASDCFWQMVGDRVLWRNAAARAFYETLRAYETHHAEEHGDCEAEAYERMERAMAALSEVPVAIPEVLAR